MWRSEAHRAALLELAETGLLPRRLGQAEAWDELATLPWTRRTTRRNELALDLAHRLTVLRLLDTVWPDWPIVAAELRALGLSPDERGLERLADATRAKTLPTLPGRLNRRTATAAVAPHSKATLTETRRRALGSVEVTRDGILRLRPHRGATFARGTAVLHVDEWFGLLGEIALPERALRDGVRLTGPSPTLVLLVENVGTFVDLRAPEDWLIVHVPGWNTATLRSLIDQLTDSPLVLFGDLDPAGVEIFRHLHAACPLLRWATFDLWRTLIPDRVQPCQWPENFDLSDCPELLRELARHGWWLEQETLVLHPALISAIVREAGL